MSKPKKQPKGMLQVIEQDLSTEEQENTKGLGKILVCVNYSAVIPGSLIYNIEQLPVSEETPYPTFRPVPRIVVDVHNPGEMGTTFLTYAPRLVKSASFHDKLVVEADTEVIYSPLTREHAEFVCNELNKQMRHFFEKKMAKIQNFREKQK